MESILKVSDLNKSYGNFSLSNVSFSLPEGCITGFIGVNGAGKTTTLRTILELTNRTSGHIEFFGLDMQSHEQEIKNRIGVQPKPKTKNQYAFKRHENEICVGTGAVS